MLVLACLLLPPPSRPEPRLSMLPAVRAAEQDAGYLGGKPPRRRCWPGRGGCPRSGCGGHCPLLDRVLLSRPRDQRRGLSVAQGHDQAAEQFLPVLAMIRYLTVDLYRHAELDDVTHPFLTSSP